jgi:pantothenate kinase-related protein Tda10
MTSVICDAFKLEGKSCVAMSLDDFYLTGQQQEQLAKRYLKNDLLQYRGNGQS